MDESTGELIVNQKELIDPRSISKKNDQEGRDKLAAEIRESRILRGQLKDQVSGRETELDQRQESILFKLKQKLNIPDAKTIELQKQILEAKTVQDQLPDSREMIKSYYEKVSETPLSNQEKRELLKPEVLASLSTEEYITLWKRLNPQFLSHVTRQGFRDHNAMMYHSAGLQEFHNGFLDVMKDGKELKPPLALDGLRDRDETTVKTLLSSWVLQAENESEAETRFNNLLNFSFGSAPKYPDKTAVHFAAQVVADDYYGGEEDNEVFFTYPSDFLASQYNFAFNGWEKDFTKPQSEKKWNDVFIWPNSLKDPGISVDAGVVFLPEKVQVDPVTGSKYASEIKNVDGKDRRVMVENTDLVNKFNNWATNLNRESAIVQTISKFETVMGG